MEKDDRAGVLLVGGCGHWAAKENHIPAILDMKKSGIPVNVVGICDPRDPGLESNTREMPLLAEIVNLDKPQWINPSNMTEQELHQELDRLAADRRLDVVIIACNPVHHGAYLLWAASRGIHALCDKPIICTEDAAWNQSAAAQMKYEYDNLLKLTEQHDPATAPKIAIPLRRRANDAFLTTASELENLYQSHGQGVTNLNLVKNAGMYRLPAEYEFGDAHGYRSGVGSLSFSSYHFIDVLAWYLSIAPGDATHLSVSMPYIRRLRDYISTQEAFRLGGLIDGRKETASIDRLDERTLRCEVDFVFHADILDAAGKSLGLVAYSCFNNTYSHRTVGLSQADQAGIVPFREKGRMSQFVLDLNQGNLQHIRMSKNDVVGEKYSIDIEKRTNPSVTSEPKKVWRFENAHTGSKTTPQGLTREFIMMSAGKPFNSSIERQISYLPDQRLTHHLFSSFYQLIADEFSGEAPKQQIIEI